MSLWNEFLKWDNRCPFAKWVRLMKKAARVCKIHLRTMCQSEAPNCDLFTEGLWFWLTLVTRHLSIVTWLIAIVICHLSLVFEICPLSSDNCKLTIANWGVHSMIVIWHLRNEWRSATGEWHSSIWGYRLSWSANTPPPLKRLARFALEGVGII